MIPILPEDLEPVLQHLEATWPDEGCGLILRGPGGFRIRRMRNSQDLHHARDPLRYPRSARTAFVFDPAEQLQVEKEREAANEELSCIFHSHVDSSPRFSVEDQQMAAPGGEPWWPGVSYLVISVMDGRATSASIYWWKGARFEGAPVRIPR